MNHAPLNLAAAFAAIHEHWRPRIAAECNGSVVKIVKFQGEFVWHTHADTDELFLVHKGAMTIRFRDRDVRLQAGELFVIPRGKRRAARLVREVNRDRAAGHGERQHQRRHDVFIDQRPPRQR